MLDWLRDWREAREYNSPIVILFDKNGSLTAVAVIMTMLESVKRPNGAIGWMPADCDHYNQWVIKRKNNKKLDDYYFPELADQTCETCAHNATTTDGITHCKFPECAHGNISRWKAEQEECPKCKGTGAIGGYNIEKGYFWDGECPTCNGTGKIQGWDLDCPDCTGTVDKKETDGGDDD